MDDVKLKVKFMPMNVEHEIDFNETVLHLAQRHDIHIQSVCKGLPSCAECRICIQDGEHHVPPPSSKELSLIGTAHYIDRSRLACQLRCFGDITVDLTEQLEKATRAAKQPQGRHTRKEGEVSHAVKGNLIDSYTEDNDKSLADVIDTGVRPGQDDFYKEPAKKQNNQNQRRGGGNQQGQPGHRQRNDNRNQNRNQGGGQQGPNKHPNPRQGQGQTPAQNQQRKPQQAQGNQQGRQQRPNQGRPQQRGPQHNQSQNRAPKPVPTESPKED